MASAGGSSSAGDGGPRIASGQWPVDSDDDFESESSYEDSSKPTTRTQSKRSSSMQPIIEPPAVAAVADDDSEGEGVELEDEELLPPPEQARVGGAALIVEAPGVEEDQLSRPSSRGTETSSAALAAPAPETPLLPTPAISGVAYSEPDKVAIPVDPVAPPTPPGSLTPTARLAAATIGGPREPAEESMRPATPVEPMEPYAADEVHMVIPGFFPDAVDGLAVDPGCGSAGAIGGPREPAEESMRPATPVEPMESMRPATPGCGSAGAMAADSAAEQPLVLVDVDAAGSTDDRTPSLPHTPRDPSAAAAAAAAAAVAAEEPAGKAAPSKSCGQAEADASGSGATASATAVGSAKAAGPGVGAAAAGSGLREEGTPATAPDTPAPSVTAPEDPHEPESSANKPKALPSTEDHRSLGTRLHTRALDLWQRALDLWQRAQLDTESRLARRETNVTRTRAEESLRWVAAKGRGENPWPFCVTREVAILREACRAPQYCCQWMCRRLCYKQKAADEVGLISGDQDLLFTIEEVLEAYRAARRRSVLRQAAEEYISWKHAALVYLGRLVVYGLLALVCYLLLALIVFSHRDIAVDMTTGALADPADGDGPEKDLFGGGVAGGVVGTASTVSLRHLWELPSLPYRELRALEEITFFHNHASHTLRVSTVARHLATGAVELVAQEGSRLRIDPSGRAFYRRAGGGPEAPLAEMEALRGSHDGSDYGWLTSASVAAQVMVPL